MQIIRYRSAYGKVALGVSSGDRYFSVFCEHIVWMDDMLLLHCGELRSRLEEAVRSAEPSTSPSSLLAPIDGDMEVWAAGVTYKRSEEDRMEESGTPDIYAQVYAAERPELFFKATPRRVIAPNSPIAVRGDSIWHVPEPELTVVVNAHAEIAGYTIGNDVSSRSIEGENPLYLPQAKVYAGSCALGPGITPAWEIANAYDLTIRMIIKRDGRVDW